MKLDVDTKQKIKTTFSFLLECYKVFMGTFLLVFVPVNCDNHECGPLSLITQGEINERIAIIMNMLSCLMFIVLYGFELNRENWCIKHLDIDDNKPMNNLDAEIENYKEIKDDMSKINKTYKKIIIACSGTQMVNLGISMSYLVERWNGTTTLTPLLSYVLLVMMKLVQSFNIAKLSIKEERAYSAYLSGLKTYNTIDVDMKHMKDNDNIQVIEEGNNESVKDVAEINIELKEDDSDENTTSI